MTIGCTGVFSQSVYYYGVCYSSNDYNSGSFSFTLQSLAGAYNTYSDGNCATIQTALNLVQGGTCYMVGTTFSSNYFY